MLMVERIFALESKLRYQSRLLLHAEKIWPLARSLEWESSGDTKILMGLHDSMSVKESEL